MRAIRAGNYAEFAGRTYSCESVRKPYVRIYLPPGEDPPEGFEQELNGRWSRLLDRSQVSRLYHVVTEATWVGHQVTVDEVDDAEAWVWSQTYPPPSRSEVVLDRDSWTAKVPIAELENVIEAYKEAPLT